MSRQRKITLGIILAVLAVVVVAWAIVKPTAYDYGKAYKFQYTFQSNSRTGDGRIVPTRSFVFENGNVFAAPLESTGRRIVVFDASVPANTFRLVNRKVPPAKVGSRQFDKGGTYDEVQFNFVVREVQRVIPRVTPRNKR